jgi:hypothetical protein
MRPQIDPGSKGCSPVGDKPQETTMALEIAVMTNVAGEDGGTSLIGTVYPITSNSLFAETIADFLGIRAEYNASLSGFGIMEIPASRLLDLNIDRHQNQINGVNLREHNYNSWDRQEIEEWDASELYDAKVAALAPGARIIVRG